MSTTKTLVRPGLTPSPDTPSPEPKVRRDHVGRIVTATILGGLVASAIALTGPFAGVPSAPASTPATSELARPTEAVDGIFPIDGAGFHLHCTGAGETTVLLIPGWGAGGDDSWSAVQPSLAGEARVCTYDRPGTGTSDAPAGTQTFETEARDLRALLEVAGEPGPYVVVGHSFGGAEAVTFAARASGDVDGLVLVDASPPTWPAAVCAVPEDGTEAASSYVQLCRIMRDPMSDPERLDVIPAFERVATIGSLGDIPMTVITADTRTSPGIAAAELTRLNAVWDQGMTTWAALSSSSNVVTVTDTGHNIQIEHPGVVLAEVTQLLRAPAPEDATSADADGLAGVSS